MTDEITKRLRDVLAACRAIGSFTEGLKRAADEDADLVQRIPDMRRIIGLRNRVIHGYDAVDDEIVWDVVRTKLPVLEAQILALIDGGGHGSNGNHGNG